MSKKAALFILLLAYGVGVGAQRALAQTGTTAQTPATATSNNASQSSAASNQPKTNDLEITANVTARELRFEVVPDPKVEFPGKPERETVWEAERQNLPRPVQPGVTYRNIGIQLKITSVFADIDRIVAEALGETPITDDAPRDKAAPPSNTTPAPSSPSATQGERP